MIQITPAVLVLADGNVYQGWSFGRLDTVIGEVVFNTGMTGYQEILTDPSYCGQIITFTYPELGNTGVNLTDIESNHSFAKGIVIKNICKFPSNWRNEKSLLEYLQMHNIMCIYGLDTRSLTKHLRKSGSMNGAISNEILNPSVLLPRVNSALSMEGADLVTKVTTPTPYSSYKQISIKHQWYFLPIVNNKLKRSMRVIVIDFGVKINILRRLQDLNCETIVVPASTNIRVILSYKPDGILLSNGPGDPSAVVYGINTIKNLLQYSIPMFGICMGHQLLSIALGCNTYKLKFGHRGLNHPTGWFNKVHITSQNHGFAVGKDLSSSTIMQMSHINFNDDTVAGLTHMQLPLFSVQYHPEASPGPHDSDYLFAYFVSMMYQYNLKKQQS